MAQALPADIERVLVSEEQIAAAVQRLAADLQRDYSGHNPVLVGALNGCTVFLADLMRQLPFALTVDYVAVSSYGAAAESKGCLQWKKDVSCDLAGRQVVLVEDIVDTGCTLAALREAMRERGAASVTACALLDKPSRRLVDVAVEYVGLQIPDEFVVGYGLDFNQCYRNLPYVGVLARRVYARGEVL